MGRNRRWRASGRYIGPARGAGSRKITNKITCKIACKLTSKLAVLPLLDRIT